MVFRFRSALLAALIAGVALWVPAEAQAQDRPQFNREDAVSSADIRASERGHLLLLSDGTEVRITGARADERPRQECLVHVPSLTRQIERGLREGALQPIGTAAQQVQLQVRQDPTTGELWCGGAGTGCTIIIQ